MARCFNLTEEKLKLLKELDALRHRSRIQESKRKVAPEPKRSNSKFQDIFFSKRNLFRIVANIPKVRFVFGGVLQPGNDSEKTKSDAANRMSHGKPGTRSTQKFASVRPSFQSLETARMRQTSQGIVHESKK
jgi:hypothetical protein